MIKNELLYPIFLDCCLYADDDFWKYILEDLAYGRSPYGTYIKKIFYVVITKIRNLLIK